MAKKSQAQYGREKWLLIDIGNTALSFQALEGGQYSDLFSIQHSDIPKKISKLALSGLIDSSTYIVIVSVVPKISLIVKNLFRQTAAKRILEVGHNLPIHFKHKYNNFNKLGNDRKVNIFGALELYGGPCVIFDFGTALTVDAISSKGIFDGGFIIPGPQIAFQALTQKTALLPNKLPMPLKIVGFLGNDTLNCMKNGILVGYSSMASGLVQRFRKLYGKKVQFIATGGFAEPLASMTPEFDRVDPCHTLKSLALLALSHTAQ